VQLLFPLSEPGLADFFSLLDLLFPASVHLTGTGFELTLKLRLATPGLLLNFGLFFHQAGIEGQGHFLLAQFQLVFKVIFPLA
jgi:hypothetical protein